ncbi:MAG: prepilin-type N-terminal cleavage/methylation domain-containing protein [Colwellia sp.]
MLAYEKVTTGLKNSGFTLMELIIVIIILGIMSVGLAGFITLSTQSYLNVTERDELLANARFSVERLNREIRNALPHSVRVKNSTTSQCIEFVPIVASTVYTAIAVAPEAAVNSLSVIPFELENGDDYSCNAGNSCDDVVIVYPINNTDIYQDHTDNSGKAFEINKYPAASSSEIQLKQTATFNEHSPTQRAYIINSPVSYCINGTAKTLTRYTNYGVKIAQDLPPSIVSSPTLESSLMANKLSFDGNDLPFTVLPASLQRNAVVQIKLNFTRDDEQVVFDNAIHINNTP